MFTHPLKDVPSRWVTLVGVRRRRLPKCCVVSPQQPDRFHKKQNGVRNVHREVTKMDDESFLWAQAKQLPKGGKDLPMTVEKFFTLLVKNLA